MGQDTKYIRSDSTFSSVVNLKLLLKIKSLYKNVLDNQKLKWNWYSWDFEMLTTWYDSTPTKKNLKMLRKVLDYIVLYYFYDQIRETLD